MDEYSTRSQCYDPPYDPGPLLPDPDDPDPCAGEVV